MKPELISTTEAARILDISRIAVFKKIKSGQIKAKKVGRNFVIDKRDLSPHLRVLLTPKLKTEIERAVKKTVAEYSETLKLLGRE